MIKKARLAHDECSDTLRSAWNEGAHCTSGKADGKGNFRRIGEFGNGFSTNLGSASSSLFHHESDVGAVANTGVDSRIRKRHKCDQRSDWRSALRHIAFRRKAVDSAVAGGRPTRRTGSARRLRNLQEEHPLRMRLWRRRGVRHDINSANSFASSRAMRIKQKLCDDTVDDQKLDEAESLLKASLPICYREFLKVNNGGKPEPSGFSFTLRNGETTNSTVHYFFAIHNGRVGNLFRQFEITKDRIPSGLLAIATDPFGNLIAIPTLKQTDVPVYFWDHEKEIYGAPWFDNMATISDSFEKFINNLQ
jgi:hypothetical protein